MGMMSTKLDNPHVLIVDDDEGVRTGLRALIVSVGIEASCFGSTQEFLAADLPQRPGCLILDVRMPGSSGFDLQSRLAAKGDTRPIIFLTGHGDVPMAVRAMKAGAVDFLMKPVRDQILLDAVTAAIEKDIARRREAEIVERYCERFAILTPRERQVFGEVARGQVNKQIAFDLGISEVTVKLHRGNVMRKMQAISVGQLVRAWDALPADRRAAPEPAPKHGYNPTHNVRIKKRIAVHAT